MPRAPRRRAAVPATAVDEQASFGASVIKVALNAEAGPVFDAATLDAIVARAHERGLPVVAHVEGDGMTRLARRRRSRRARPHAVHRAARRRAHRPGGGERAAMDLDARHPSRRCADARDARAREPDGVRRAPAARVLYGTDLGNGDLPVGVNARRARGARMRPASRGRGAASPRSPTRGRASSAPTASPPSCPGDAARRPRRRARSGSAPRPSSPPRS